MKKIFLFLSFVFAFYFANAQVKEGVGGYATISAVSLVSGTTYNFTITGFNSNVRPRGQDSYTTLDLAVGCVIWSTDCNKFVIASVSANTGITMVGTMTSIDAAQAPPTNGTKIAVFKEITTNNFTTYSLPPAADGNGVSLFGISIGMKACIDAHYRRQDSIAFANISGGGSIDTSYNGIQTLRKTNATYVKGNDEGLKITNKGDTAQVVGLDFPSLDYRTGSILSSDLIPISDGTNHYKIRADSLKSLNTISVSSVLNNYITGNISVYGFVAVNSFGGNINKANTSHIDSLHQFYIISYNNTKSQIETSKVIEVTASFSYSVGVTYYLQDDGTLASTADGDGDAQDYDSTVCYCIASLGSSKYLLALKDPKHFAN